MKSARDILTQWNSKPPQQFIFDSNPTEISLYLNAVDQIQSLQNHQNNNLISISINRLKLEFQNILTKQTDSLTNTTSTFQSSITDSTAYEFHDDDYTTSNLPNKDSIQLLQKISQIMSKLGFITQCVEIYITVRKPFVDSRFKALGVERLSYVDVKGLHWDEMKVRIEVWIRAAYVCVRSLFARERKICEEIFGGCGNECFAECVRDAAVELFGFAECVSDSRVSLSTVKLFKCLDFYKALLDLSPDIRVLKGFGVRVDVDGILVRVEEMVRRIVLDFENQVVRDISVISEAGGGIHKLTKYVMNYISQIVNHKKILNELIVSKPKPLTGFENVVIPDMEFVRVEGKTPLGLHLVLIIVVLRYNLEGKCKIFSQSDACLVDLFMMNNIHYIVQHIKGSQELRDLIGGDYLNKLTGYVEQAIISCRTLSCENVLYCLRDEGLHGSMCVSSRLSKSVLRERIKSFYDRFDELHGFQKSWVITDLQLREHLRSAISESLIPDYKSFLDRYRSHIESRRFPNIIKYSVDDLRTLVLRFFIS